MANDSRTYSGWQDSIELVIALWLIASPFVLGFISEATPSATAIILGTAVFMIAQLGIAEQRPWEEWVSLTCAALLAISPWMLSYAENYIATLNAIISGGVMALFAILAMVDEYDQMRKQNKASTSHT